MKKITIITITKGSAVDKLAEMIKKYNPHLDITIFPFHAKRHSTKDLDNFERVAKDADLLDFEYWRSFEVLLQHFPWISDKKKILTHHNPYDLDKIPPALVDQIVVKNYTQKERLPISEVIPQAVDLDFLTFNEDYIEGGTTVGMVAFRIVPEKGILEVAQVCRKLGYNFLLVGHISDPEYYEKILETGVNIDIRLDITEKELHDAYKEMTVLVCNSKDNFESGPMPVLEAMAVGVPVLTRKVGIITDIYSGENMIIREGERSDVEGLEKSLKALVEDKDIRLKIRKNAWDTIKTFSAKRMAVMYSRIYNRVLFGGENPLVSIITPVFNRTSQIEEIMQTLEKQTYKNIELVICDDDSEDKLSTLIEEYKKKYNYPIKYLNTKKEGYNLAMARNFGVIEADGKYLMFLDSRFIPAENAVEVFLEATKRNYDDKVWFFGDKGSGKKSFVENFSFIKRKSLISAGMFCERITEYGGMSQEIRSRFIQQGFNLVFLPEAKAKEILTATKWQKRTSQTKNMKYLIWKMYEN